MRVSARHAALLTLPLLLFTAACEGEEDTAAPQSDVEPTPSASPSPELPTLHELVRAHIADTWEYDVDYAGRCETLSEEEEFSLIRGEGICLSLYADVGDSTVFVLGPPATEPFEALRLTTPDGEHWELVENFVIEDPYGPGPDWLDEAIRIKDDPSAWEITAPTLAEVGETWLADRYLPLDCEATGEGGPDHEAWCVHVEGSDDEENPTTDRGTVLITRNGEPYHRLFAVFTGEEWRLYDEFPATE